MRLRKTAVPTQLEWIRGLEDGRERASWTLGETLRASGRGEVVDEFVEARGAGGIQIGFCVTRGN